MRSRDTWALAERALTDLAAALGERANELTVIGGLNADLLTDVDDAPHEGTVDVDILLQLGFVYERDDVDFGWLEAGLIAAGFAPRPHGVGWRWWRTSDGYPVKVELICDVYDRPEQEIALPGCARASAQNLRGPAAALTSPVVRAVASDGRGLSGPVGIRFASLGGYVLSKAAAAFGRALDKDFYDLAFVLLHNREGGPAAAARGAYSALPSEPLMDYPRVFGAVLDVFADPGGPAARAYGEQRARDGVGVDVDVLAQDAVAAAQICRDEFDRLISNGLDGAE
jgi:hypothetical protein